MMVRRSFGMLRQLGPCEVAHSRTAALCGKLGVAVRWVRPPRDVPLLALEVSTPRIRMRGRVLACHWYASTHPDFADIAWDEVIRKDTALSLDKGRARVRFTAWPDDEVEIERVERPSPLAPTDVRLPALEIGDGMFWIDSLDVARAAGAPELARIPVVVDFHLTSLRLSLRALRSLGQGAVLLLDALDPHGRVGEKRIFNYDFTVENCTVTHTFEFTDEIDAPDADSVLRAGDNDSSSRQDLGLMPVVVEVVLCRSNRHLQDLAELQPGAVFELPVDAWQSLELRVNGARIATGELVQVGERLGVQILKRLAIA